MSACKVAVTFLKAHNKIACSALGFKIRNKFADILKSREQILKFAVILLCDNLCQIGGNKRLNGNRILREKSLFLFLRKDVIKEHCSDLITAHKNKFARIIGNGYTHSVAVRVGGKENIRTDFFIHLKSELKHLLNLGIRKRTGRKIAVRFFLLGNDINILNAYSVKNFSDRFITRTVKRSIDNLKVGFSDNIGIQTLLLHLVKK